ncbi:MAG: hypothetical protein JWN89_3 [Parcubacteria group bacterium]|nr:hypothetical protein [Parcubacteria group bacterium]
MSGIMFKKILNIFVYIFAVIGLVLVLGYFGVRYGLTNTKGIVDVQREWFLRGAGTEASSTPPVWTATGEWKVLEEAIRKDEVAITRAAKDAEISPRLIVANLITEQMRLFFTEREFYKQFFFPLKILGSQTQFSWGVMGMKEGTAINVEKNLLDPASPYYPGWPFEHMLDFKTDKIKDERFTRMTDQHDHYYSYLYAGLYMKEIITAWQNTGFPIQNKPEIISTLYNIGFENSRPNPSPAIGGAEVQIGGQRYSFGGLAGEFYYSDILTDIFPR